MTDTQLQDIFTETSGLLDVGEDDDIDLASRALQIWQNALKLDPSLARVIPAMPNVTYSTKAHDATATKPNGVLVYMRTADGNDALAWMDRERRQRHAVSACRSASC